MYKINVSQLDWYFDYIRLESKKRGTWSHFEEQHNKLKYEVSYWQKEKANSTTTTGPSTIVLAANFFKLPHNDAVATLLHETAHIRQYSWMGKTNFLANYFLSSGARAELELAGVREDIRWLTSIKFNFAKTWFSEKAQEMKKFYKLWFVSPQQLNDRLYLFYIEALKEFAA